MNSSQRELTAINWLAATESPVGQRDWDRLPSAVWPFQDPRGGGQQPVSIEPCRA
jgi:hypothetical protein